MRRLGTKLTIVTLFFATIGYSQERSLRFTISGTISDLATGETLIGATVKIVGTNTGTITNQYGFYSITLPKGEYTISIGYVGYKTRDETIVLDTNLQKDIQLAEEAGELDEIVVTATPDSENITRINPGSFDLNMKDISSLPVLFGEKDPLKILQLLPGIKSAGEGNSGFHVRGGAADQNLVLLDEALVYNPSHMLGFFSTFNADAIKDMSVYKGGMPAQYGGRLSSVLDIKMKEGNNQELHAGGGIGLIASRIFVEGPIVPERSSFLITARRTYADIFLQLSNDPTLNQNKLYFYDLNVKANYKVGDHDRVYLSGYFGRDLFSFQSNFGIDWGNATGTLRWNHIYNEKLFSNTSAVYSNYSYEVEIDNGSNNFSLRSSIADVNLKHEFNFYPGPDHELKFGISAIYHTLSPRERMALSEQSSVNDTSESDKNSLESSIFVSDTWKMNDEFSLEYGVRGTAFSILGGSNFYTLDDHQNVVDTIAAPENEIFKNYFNIEPRVSVSYQFSEQTSIKSAYSRNVQNLHLISNSTTSTPNDRWIQSSNNIKPEIADQISLGYFRNFESDAYEFSWEVYYKKMQNQIDYKDAADLVFSENIETQLLYGCGRAYGSEWLIRKKKGKLTGWIGYTLSRTERNIEGINGGEWYPARQDRTHDVSIVGTYRSSPKWTFSFTWVYSTGNAVSFPAGKYIVDNGVVFYYTERNGYRMPAYHRLDLAATLNFVKNKKFESDLSFSLYNAYGRSNAYSIEFVQSIEDSSRTQIERLTLFQFVPSITYNVKF